MSKEPAPAARHDRTLAIPTPYRRLDALARLLEYVGVCAAVAVDPDTGQIIVAHNKPSEKISELVTKYVEIFSNIAINPEKAVPVEKLLELVAESASGLSSNKAIISDIGKSVLYQTLTADGVSDETLIESFMALHLGKTDPDQILKGQIQQSISDRQKLIKRLNTDSATARRAMGRDLDEAIKAKLQVNMESYDAQIVITQGELKRLEEVLPQLDTSARGDQSEREYLVRAIRIAQPYFEMQMAKLHVDIEREIDTVSDPDLPNKAHDISRLMIDIDKIVNDLRTPTGFIYEAMTKETPVVILQHIVDPESTMHAEMKIARYFMRRLPLGDDSQEFVNKVQRILPYIGISKLCCYDCDKVLRALQVATRGTHGTRSPEWIRPLFLNAMLRVRELIERMVRQAPPSKAANARVYADSSPFLTLKPSPLRPGGKYTTDVPAEQRRSTARRALFIAEQRTRPGAAPAR